MQIHCKACRAKILAEDINLEKTLAKCRGCNAVFDFSGQLEPEQRQAARSRPRPEVPLPPKFRMEDWGRDLVITWRWFSPKFLALAFFCAFWDGFLVFWYVMAFRQGAPLVMKLFPILHLAVGVGLTYFTLAGFLNRTAVKVSRDALGISHSPLPWPGNRVLPSTEIEQLYCGERMHRHRHSCSYSYQLNAVGRDGSKIKLISGLEEPEAALFLEQAIEARLGIQDRPVRGELER